MMTVQMKGIYLTCISGHYWYEWRFGIFKSNLNNRVTQFQNY